MMNVKSVGWKRWKLEQKRKKALMSHDGMTYPCVITSKNAIFLCETFKISVDDKTDLTSSWKALDFGVKFDKRCRFWGGNFRT